ncbi:lysozyme [Tsuneonella suprasediminis]|uniref:lysozyme n=1 Tax=Tsuneonella suprasediminis TaxID=2306996 RepID=UPI002F9505BB
MTATDLRKPIFDAIKKARDNKPFDQMEVGAVDNLLDALGVGRDSVAGRKISKAGLDLIKQFEGCKLTAYPDPDSSTGEPWTIGFGTTVYPTGRKVRPGDRITEAQALEYLDHNVARFEQAVNRLTGGITTQDQFDALVSFAYNVGEGDGGLKTSTLLRLHNEGDYAAAADQFARWKYNDGKVSNGLIRRRAAEAALYRSGS